MRNVPSAPAAAPSTAVVNHDFDRTILTCTRHRPWPIPAAPWVMTQTWHDLLFAHWPVSPSRLRPLVPAPFDLDLFEGQAWIGIVPFHMTNVAPRGVPSLPWLSEFSELNVRTYVRVRDRPGIYFFSLDAASSVAVAAARAILNLPYHTASMDVTRTSAGVDYESVRAADPGAHFKASYAPAGPPVAPAEGSLEYFLTERYCLYDLGRRGRPYRLEIHHPPWPLQPATASITRNTMGHVNRVSLPATPPLLHFATRQDMVAWAPTRLSQGPIPFAARR